jgi:dolichol-phosphate mannosyltransferase
MKVVIIPATYNEKGNIERLITILEEEVFPKIKNHDMHILVADDSSPDGTADEVRKLMKKWKNLNVNVGERKGLGAAYVRAMSYAIEKEGADIVFEIDADLSHDPREVPNFLKKIDEGYDMVVGTRYSDGGSMPQNWPIHRKAFSVFGNLLVRAITFRFSYHDWTGGMRAIKKDLFLKQRDKVRPFQGYTFQVAFLYKSILDGYKIAEVPIHFADRSLGKSKIAPLEYIINLLKYVITERIIELKRFVKFLMVGGTGFILNAGLYWILVNYSDLSLVMANTAAAQVAIFSNYNLNNAWTFKDRKNLSIVSYFLKMLQFFFTSNIGVFIFQNGAIKIGDLLYGRQYYFVYFILGTALLLIWNFTIYSKVIWKKKPQSK